MRWLFLVLGLVVGFAAGAGGGQVLIDRIKNPDGSDIILAAKYFVETEDYVVVSGTLVERGVGVANNSYTVACYQARKECWIASFRQTDAKSISRIEPPYELDIVEWTPSKVTALADGALGCTKTTITIGRQSKEVLWVSEPVNQSQAKCRTDDPQPSRYSIEDSPGWTKLRQTGFGPAR